MNINNISSSSSTATSAPSAGGTFHPVMPQPGTYVNSIAYSAPNSIQYPSSISSTSYKHPPVNNIPSTLTSSRTGAPLEVIDLTWTPPPGEPVVEQQPAKRRKKDVDNQYYAQQQQSKSNNQAVAEPLAPGQSPYDDKEGHYIVRVNDDLTPRYKIMRLLGQGTFGKVVEAYDRTKKIRVAIKIIRAVQKYRDASKIEMKVLNALKVNDPYNQKRCIHLMGYFDYRNHICMVFELLSQSVFDFLKANEFHPFPTWQIQSFSAQIIEAVAFLHNLRLIHTDLKPENIMLEDNSCRVIAAKHYPYKVRRELLHTRIRLIDFGSAIFEEDYHSSVVSTRHYRAPEIILGLGWSFPCDMWSVGCIMVEFFTGDALFQTHDNLEHLAMMEVVFGKLPDSMIKSLSGKESAKYFRPNGTVNWPTAQTTRASRKYVKKLQPIDHLLRPYDELTMHFLDLVKRLLTYDPKERITAREALQHPFFRVRL
ncbi:dual specificity protein kinase kns1 [Chytridiales sp. JEL 0842]|nr:dual specificity protein kinase kns1 [Chytridiales sp. JEL 0842]